MPSKFSQTTPLGLPYAEELRGKRFAFKGRFSRWPEQLFGDHDPQRHVKARGAKLVQQLDEATDFLVVGDGRERGKAATLRQAEHLHQHGAPIRTLTEREFLYLVRPDITNRSFAFVGDFAHLPKDDDSCGAVALAKANGAVIHDTVTDALDFLIVGERRAKGKTAVLRQAEALRADGAKLRLLEEHEYLELLVCLTAPGSQKADVPTLVLQLRSLVDPRRVDRALTMLKKASFQLYTDVSEDRLVGIVRSQGWADSYYACWIGSDGSYTCFDKELSRCMGLQGKLCKHAMVLLIGMSQTADVSPATAIAWVEAAHKQRPVNDEDLSAQTLLRYQGVEAGEVDWRPTETVPEDFYTL